MCASRPEAGPDSSLGAAGATVEARPLGWNPSSSASTSSADSTSFAPVLMSAWQPFASGEWMEPGIANTPHPPPAPPPRGPARVDAPSEPRHDGEPGVAQRLGKGFGVQRTLRGRVAAADDRERGAVEQLQAAARAEIGRAHV